MLICIYAYVCVIINVHVVSANQHLTSPNAGLIWWSCSDVLFRESKPQKCLGIWHVWSSERAGAITSQKHCWVCGRFVGSYMKALMPGIPWPIFFLSKQEQSKIWLQRSSLSQPMQATASLLTDLTASCCILLHLTAT